MQKSLTIGDKCLSLILERVFIFAVRRRLIRSVRVMYTYQQVDEKRFDMHYRAVDFYRNSQLL